LALASVNGMNRFSASIILYQATPQNFLDMSDEERIEKFSYFIGVHALVRIFLVFPSVIMLTET
jgi:hypothetical protein